MFARPPSPARAAALAGAALGALLAAACAGAPAVQPRYRPAENALEVIAVLRAHIPDDTYRFEPARDFTGRNVYRSSLLRLENLERVHADALRAGHLDGAIGFAKGRSLERLRAFDLAADEYRYAAAAEPQLEVPALRSAALCDALHEARSVGLDLADFAGAGDGARAALAWPDPEHALGELDLRVARLEALLPEARSDHYAAVVREEIERTDLARARYFVALRKSIPDGDLRAVSELERVVVRHRDSKAVARHLLALADLYGELAAEYVEAHPPEGLRFDPARFQELIDSASRLYELVAARDGTPEKLEASRRLEAFLAFALRVDRDRFTP